MKKEHVCREFEWPKELDILLPFVEDVTEDFVTVWHWRRNEEDQVIRLPDPQSYPAKQFFCDYAPWYRYNHIRVEQNDEYPMSEPMPDGMILQFKTPLKRKWTQ